MVLGYLCSSSSFGHDDVGLIFFASFGVFRFRLEDFSLKSKFDSG